MDAISDTAIKANFENAIQETVYLLVNPANAERLRASIAEAEAGNTISISVDSL